MKIKCNWCNGTGYDQEHYYRCSDCEGKGMVRVTLEDKIKKLKLKRIVKDDPTFAYYKVYKNGVEVSYSTSYILETSIKDLIQADKENKKRFKKYSFVQRVIDKLFFMRMKLFR